MKRRKGRGRPPKKLSYLGWAGRYDPSTVEIFVGDHITVRPPWGTYTGKVVACDFATVTLKQADGARIQINGRYHVEKQSLLDVLAYEATAKKSQGGPC